MRSLRGTTTAYVAACTVAFCALLTACSDDPRPVVDDPEPDPFPEFGEVVTLSDHREVRIRFESDGVILVGTLYLPMSGSDLSAAAVNPGSGWDARSTWDEVGFFVQGLNMGVFSYDRRGFGESGGDLPSGSDPASIDILSGDLASAANALGSAPLIRADRIGVIGGSFGGWVVPLAANLARETIHFTIVFVGGVISSGQEALYDELTGFSDCQRTATSMEDIVRALRDAGPSGFDPRESLLGMTQPGIWFYGGLDFSHPADFSAELLAEVEVVDPKDWTVVILPNANHEFIEGGGICQSKGPSADLATPLLAWIDQIFGP